MLALDLGLCLRGGFPSRSLVFGLYLWGGFLLALPG